jgi:hypothetical protein
MANAIGHEPEGDFDAAAQHVMNKMTIPKLVLLSSLHMSDPMAI